MGEQPVVNKSGKRPAHPAILAPAGGRAAFLAALAAGADALYCGLKKFSARMAAENFTIEELAGLSGLAHEQGVEVYIVLNTLVKPDELNSVGRLVERLSRWVKPDALIVQDLAILSLARQAGFPGEIHLSTLSNISFPDALNLVSRFPEVKRVVLPRELSIDEIKAMARQCPDGLSLEVFVHGALCYAVSGRCYWSSFLGGKSGLRGRCVQPCRRAYAQDGKTARCFSCQDLSVDVLTKLLVNIPRVSSLKIEGRKKGPHYVYYTVLAYRMLRDHSNDPQIKKQALSFLEYALGRTGTHYNLLPQRPQKPVNIALQTASGLMIGRVKGPLDRPHVIPRMALMKNDILRIGYEDDAGHMTLRVGRHVPKKGRLYIRVSGRGRAENNTPVFLIDRREEELEKQISFLERSLGKYPRQPGRVRGFSATLPKKAVPRFSPFEMTVMRRLKKIKSNSRIHVGLWLDPDTKKINSLRGNRLWYWVSPVIWPVEQEKMRPVIRLALKQGYRNYVLNAPWQIALFPSEKRLNLWAGPFCNTTNALAIENLAVMGFSGVIVSPELGKEDYARLPETSPLPLGIVVSGNWPLCISRTLSEHIKTDRLFTSPRGEQAWARRYGSNFWVFPNWRIDLTGKQELLKKLGYRCLVRLDEPLPAGVKLKKRPGLLSWNLGLK